MEQVSWEDAQFYCEAIGMRLPTEAEWEYVARAGSTAARYGELDEVAWYRANSASKTHPVGQKAPSAWGLYDTLGNFWEWCSDWYGAYGKTGEEEYEVLRWGSWGNYPTSVRVSYRVTGRPAYRSYIIGFRCSGELS